MIKKYKFAFFGQSGSGKTCLLAILDMQRIPHPACYTSSRLPLEVKLPTSESWTTAKEEAEILHKSNARLEEAKKLLIEGSVPSKTELSINFLFDYKFSSQKTGEFHARLIDYSGELVEPQNAPQDIAKELREKLQGMDGLLVLAPVFRKTGELNQLQKTIGLISFSKPIALLITKWDRLDPIQETLTPDNLPSVEFRDLYNDLINKVGEKNCDVFSVSAFGETLQDKDLPKQVNPIASFGLLDAFIWLAQRLETIESEKNAIQLQNYEQSIASYKKWFPLWGKCKGKEIIRLFSKDLEMAKRAKQVQQQCLIIWWSRVLIFIPSVILMILIILSGRQAYFDQENYTQIQRILNHPNTNPSEIKKAEQWLENYYYTTPLSHPISWLFVITNGTVKYDLDKLRHRNEQQVWKTIQNAFSIEKKIQAGKTYLKMFSNSRRFSEVKAIVEKAEESLREKRDQQWWLQIEQVESHFVKLELARAYKVANPNGKHQAEITKIIAQLEEIFETEEELRVWQPVLKANTPLTQKKAAQIYLQKKPEGKSAALAQLVITQADNTLSEEWQKFITEYHDLYDNGWFLEAARWLNQEQFQDKTALELQFITNVFISLNEYIDPLIESRKWSDAYKKLDNYSNWPNEYKQGDDKIRGLRRKVEKAQDRHFYTEFLETIDIERAKNYLDFAPLQTMQNTVKAYKKYLIAIQNSLELTLILERIKWGNFSDSDNIITVYMDLKKIIEKTGVNAIANDSTGKIGSFTFRKKLSDMVTIEVEIIEKNWLTNYDQNGIGSYTGQIEQLKNGKTIVLTPPKGDFTNEAVFRLEGIPNTPHLPEWEEM